MPPHPRHANSTAGPWGQGPYDVKLRITSNRDQLCMTQCILIPNATSTVRSNPTPGFFRDVGSDVGENILRVLDPRFGETTSTKIKIHNQ